MPVWIGRRFPVNPINKTTPGTRTYYTATCSTSKWLLFSNPGGYVADGFDTAVRGDP